MTPLCSSRQLLRIVVGTVVPSKPGERVGRVVRGTIHWRPRRCLALAFAEEEQLLVFAANLERRSAQVRGSVADVRAEVAIRIVFRQVDVGDYERAVLV